MKLEPFELERFQSHWEHKVRFNLAESGVHPMQVDELIDSADLLNQLLNQYLGYNQTNGTEALRAQIARLYPKAGPDNILVTTGCIEANWLAATSLVDKGDRAVVMLPNYLQVWGVLRSLSVDTQPWWLRPQTWKWWTKENAATPAQPWSLRDSGRWEPDPTELAQLITAQTRLIAVCNPNNPTGSVLSREIMHRICELADRAGAWILADEVYQGAERNGETTPSFWGLYDKVIVTNGLSKAYGLPGLRIGWMAAPKEVVETCWGHKDYTSISPAILSDHMARLALDDAKRSSILQRTRAILKTNYVVVKAWLDSQPERFQYVEPRAGAIAWVKYKSPVNSTELVTRLLREKSVLVPPGDHFLMDGYLRIGYGLPHDQLKSAVNILTEFFKTV